MTVCIVQWMQGFLFRWNNEELSCRHSGHCQSKVLRCSGIPMCCSIFLCVCVSFFNNVLNFLCCCRFRFHVWKGVVKSVIQIICWRLEYSVIIIILTAATTTTTTTTTTVITIIIISSSSSSGIFLSQPVRGNIHSMQLWYFVNY